VRGACELNGGERADTERGEDEQLAMLCRSGERPCRGAGAGAFEPRANLVLLRVASRA